MCYHIIAFIAGFVLDLLIGDPHFIPHPVRLIGSLISFLDKRLNSDVKYNSSENEANLTKYKRGVLLAFTVIFATFAVSVIILVAAYSINLYAGIIAEAVMTWQILATKCLRVESMRVYDALRTDGVDAGRRAVSMIVGRDTSVLDEAGVTRAAVETIAENTSDGVIAPMLYTAIGGPVLGFVYKAVNTMDSMLGYKNDKYMYFGRFAARLDDVVNFIPARISAYLMIIATFIGGRQFDGRNAYRIFKRDRFNHASPNSAQTESVCAGALRVQLAGDAVYFGKLVKKKYIGDELREIEYEDIKRANRLMYITAFLCELLSVAVMSLILILL
ncbi:MAG: adenosylcobinamide-phosphate synthase CbiB [Agathobacter sp.]|uniref:adenosylcobinamide-phosphate synthase CbiB n=1 Tax=Agathobacter sp. TaxID=2021311 RepID=UPI002E7988A0|nr:adenosylcobinamide-phosphate synthase CbiB [Agathobacter sp.]MEE1217624.1 adenosylcobinamide-phosphate synthase CbiB [Agathobacter sp.]